MRKRLCVIITMLSMIVTMLGPYELTYAANTTLKSREVADYFKSRVGETAREASCLAFIADGFSLMGASRNAACCAYQYGSSHIVSASMDNIPIGADVFLNWNSNYKGEWVPCGNHWAHHIAY